MSQLRFLTQSQAQVIDEELMSAEQGFSLDQLMELAGLSCAEAIHHFYHQTNRHVLIVCGPGNNGGDGLVCARHLKHFGYEVSVCYPKAPRQELYKRLLTQLKHLNITVDIELPSADELKEYDIIVDAIFGFSFQCHSLKDIRSPFDSILQRLAQHCNNTNNKCHLVSIDIPSGWDVEKGDIHATGLMPSLLISLTAPKLAAQHFRGTHVLGGRFVPLNMASKYGLDKLPYTGSQQFAVLSESS